MDLAQAQIDYRNIGDVSYAVFEGELKQYTSPMLATAKATYTAAQPHTALFLAQAFIENKYESSGILIHAADHNPVSMRPWLDKDGKPCDPRTKDGLPPGNAGVIVAPDKSQYLRFKTDANAAAEWKYRVTDPAYKNGAYVNAHTVKEMTDIYCPPGDVHPVTGVANEDIHYADAVMAKLQQFAAAEARTTGGTSVSDTLTFGKVPFPGYVDRQAQTAHKPEGIGWDNLGKRTPLFIVLHRMEGTLSGTDSYFPTAPALTDYGIGTANVDGAALDGYIYQWNDPYGYRAGWASGPVSAPYGDGLKWLNWSGNKWGYSICNVCGVSIENSGNYPDPMTDFAFGELAKFVAYWFDQWRIPHDKAPIRPDTGISAITFHTEWTAGTGKICPGDWLMNNTQRLIDAAAAIMKPYQTGQAAPTPATPAPKPDPKPAPKPQYASPIYIPELAKLSKSDNDKAQAVTVGEGAKFVYVGDRVKAIRDTPRLQKAAKGARHTGPTIKKGEEFDVMWRFTAKDGRDYYYTPFATRIIADDVERVSDTPSFAESA